MTNRFSFSKLTRRDLLRAGMYGVGVTAGALPLPLFAQATAALAAQGKHDGKILVVLELSGGNDGLNTLVPYGDDAYYKHRPHLGIPKKEVRPIDDHFGFSGGMAGFERLYKDGKLAIVHGCGYENPSFSHFTSMAYWHTAAPNSGEEYGWVGRLADSMAPDAPPNFLVNIAARQSLAVRSRKHVPVVFDDPNKFTQEKFYEEREILDAAPAAKTGRQSLAPIPSGDGPERQGRLGAGAGSVGEIPFAGGLRNHRSRPAQGRGADRGGHAHAPVLHVLSQQRVRHARLPERYAQAAAHLCFRCGFGVPDGSGADRTRG